MLVVGYARGHNFGSDGAISRVGRALFPEIAVRPKSLGGLTLHLDLSDLSHLAVADEIFVQKVYDFDLVPFTPDVVLDCGAHIGMFTLVAVNRFPKSRLVAFEPDPENCGWLRRQIQENHLSVQVIEAAVSTSEGEVLFDAGQGCGSALSDSVAPSSSAIRVKTVDLAACISESNSKKLLLKLDVEGAEEELLPKIVDVLPKNTFLFFETHRGALSWNRLSSVLEEYAFTAKTTRARGAYTDGTAVRTSGNNIR